MVDLLAPELGPDDLVRCGHLGCAVVARNPSHSTPQAAIVSRVSRWILLEKERGDLGQGSENTADTCAGLSKVSRWILLEKERGDLGQGVKYSG